MAIKNEKSQATLTDKILCTKPWNSVYITLDGSVSFCCYLPQPQCRIGNINRESFRKIWNSKVARMIREEMLRNPLPKYCKGCPRYNARASGAKFDPDPFA